MEHCKPFLPAVCQPGRAQRDPERARRSDHAHVGEFGVGELARVLVLAQPQPGQRGARACMHVSGLAN